MIKVGVKRTLRIAVTTMFFLIIIVFAFLRSSDLIFGVKIRSVNIVNGKKIPDDFTKITGNARNAVSLTLDGREISIDHSGNFNETIALLSGYNIVNIRAQDKFGYVDEKNYKLMH